MPRPRSSDGSVPDGGPPATGIGRRVLSGLAVLVVVPLLALLGVMAADLVPDRWVMDRLFDATVVGTLDEDSYPTGYSGHRVDQFSECKRITVGLGDPEGRSMFESAVRSPTLGPCETAVPKIVGWAQGDGLRQSYEYSRYWNGSALVFRPGIAAIGVGGLRVVAALVLAGASYLVWRGLRRRVGSGGATLFLVPIVTTTDLIDLPGALLHALAWSVALAAFAMLLAVPADAPGGGVALAAFSSGAVFVFLADMTNPEAAWLLAVGALGVGAFAAGAGASQVAGRMLVGGVGWIAGFSYLWASKWVIGATVYGVEDMADNVVGQIEERLGGEHEGLSLSAWGGLQRTWAEWWSSSLTLPVVVASLVAAGVMVRRMGRATWGATWRARLVLASPVVIPLVWYGVLRNHTQVHAWFVYRSLPAAFGLLLLAAVAPAPRPGPVRSGHVGVDLVDEGA